ncbi:MAG: PD-(D/E)XK nuclease family protein, partial [Gemmatimonadota bacterium]
PTLWGATREQKGPLGVKYALAREDGGAVLDLGTARRDERRRQQDFEDDAEELRLAYVALTRAVHRCYVVWGVIGTGDSSSANSPLGHLMRTASGKVEREALLALIASAGGTMAVRDVEPVATWRMASPIGAGVAAAEPLPLHLVPHQLDSWRLTSFTGLVAGAHSEESRDVADPLLVPELPGERAPVSGFRAFPSGRHAGIALHDVFESLDFGRTGETRTRDMVQRTLSRHGLSGDGDEGTARVDDVMQMLQTVCTAPIPGATFALADVPVRDSLREWRFDLSVRSASARAIADVLAAHGSAHARAYAPALRTLGDSAVNGYLSGVVDIAFEREGRWWLMDWKSNHLGDDDADYAPEPLAMAMMQAHYTLQYHLYLVALHRYLQLRQPGYDAATHWGGVAYVFLRGVTGTGDGGWFRDVPTKALLEALDAALGRRA